MLRVCLLRWTPTFADSGNGQLRFPDAAGFLGKHISSQGISSRPRSTADLAEFTNAALAFQVLAVTQGDKKRGMPVEFRQRLLAYIPGGDGQKPAGEHFTEVGDEDEALAIVDSVGASRTVCGTCAKHRRQ